MEVFIKNEPMEDYAFQENIKSCCCLCKEGIAIQKKIIEHLTKKHPNGK
jgi:hypothetical protein